MPDMSLVMGLLGDVSHRQDVSASRLHSTLSSLIPRDRFALLPADHELFLPSVPVVVTIATMPGIAPSNWKELQRSFRAKRCVRFHNGPSSASAVPDSTVPSASTPVLSPPPPACVACGYAPEANPKGGCAESLPKFVQWLNAVPAAREADSAKSFHLFIYFSCVSDCPGPDFPRESLYSQWEYLTRNATQHPTWGSAFQAFIVQQSIQSRSEPAAVAASAAVTAAQSQNQAGGGGGGGSASSSRATSRGGWTDAHCFPIAVYIRSTAKQNVHRPCTSSKLGSVTRTVFGADHVTHPLKPGEDWGLCGPAWRSGLRPKASRVARPLCGK